MTGTCEVGAAPQMISAGEDTTLWIVFEDQYCASLSLPSSYHGNPTETTLVVG